MRLDRGLCGACLLVGIIVLIPACLLSAGEARSLVITDLTDHRVLFEVRVKPGDRFTIREIHSITKTPVEDVFEIDDQYQIIGIETIFEYDGFGGPTPGPGDDFVMDEHEMRIRNMNRRFERILLRVAALNDHIVRCGGAAINLHTATTGGNLVEIAVK